MPLRLLALFTTLLLLIATSSLAQNTPSGEVVAPPDVLIRVQLVAGDLESIRYVMGKQENNQPDIGVKGAAPREVYFQALTMFRKAERLCFELTREHTTQPALPEGNPGLGDVLRIVDATLDCLARIKTRLGIEQQPKAAPRDPTKTASDVFRATVQVNRQLNLLLERRFAPSDVFEQVTLGVGYAARLLESFPDATTMPDEPEFEVGKRPSDVYRRLTACFDQIHRLARASDLEILELKASEAQIAGAEPSDVYDIASLLVSELDYLHSQLDGAAPPREVYYAGRKFPSQVYQRAGILVRQLDELEKQIKARPGWLDRNYDPQ